MMSQQLSHAADQCKCRTNQKCLLSERDPSRVPLVSTCLLGNLRLKLACPFEMFLYGRKRASRPFGQGMLIAVRATAALNLTARLRGRARRRRLGCRGTAFTRC